MSISKFVRSVKSCIMDSVNLDSGLRYGEDFSRIKHVYRTGKTEIVRKKVMHTSMNGFINLLAMFLSKSKVRGASSHIK